MPAEDRDQKNEEPTEEVSLPVEDLNPKKVDAAKADAVRGGRASDDSEANSEKIR